MTKKELLSLPHEDLLEIFGALCRAEVKYMYSRGSVPKRVSQEQDFVFYEILKRMDGDNTDSGAQIK